MCLRFQAFDVFAFGKISDTREHISSADRLAVPIC